MIYIYIYIYVCMYPTWSGFWVCLQIEYTPRSGSLNRETDNSAVDSQGTQVSVQPISLGPMGS